MGVLAVAAVSTTAAAPAAVAAAPAAASTAAATVAATTTAAAATIAAAATAAASAAAAVAATTAAAVSAATAAATRTILTRTSFVDGQVATVEFPIVQRLDGFIGAVLHFDEPKAAAPSGFPVGRNAGARHFTKFPAQLGEIFTRGAEGQVTEEKLLHESPSAAVSRPPQNRKPVQRSADASGGENRTGKHAFIQGQHRLIDLGH
jgi:hypothetical protein